MTQAGTQLTIWQVKACANGWLGTSSGVEGEHAVRQLGQCHAMQEDGLAVYINSLKQSILSFRPKSRWRVEIF